MSIRGKEDTRARSAVVVISGATGGIGKSIGAYLWRNSWNTIGLTRHVNAPLPPGYDSMVQCDVTSPSMVESVAQHVFLRFSSCDALVIAHGYTPVTTPTVDLKPADFESVLRTDVTGAFVLAQAFGRWMIKQGHGCIVFISSLHARQTYPARVPYAAAKSAVCGMMRSLALEWGPYGIRVNCILPWQTSGSRTQQFIEKALQESGEDLLSEYCRKSPLKRIVNPIDIAKSVLYLIQNESVTGQELIIDCGVSASAWQKDY